MQNHLDKFRNIYQKALNKASDLEPWKGHFLARRIETEILTEQFNFEPDQIGLELGCGCAFQSALLASISCKIFATDLFRKNGITHSLGIERARDLVKRLNMDNLKIISCSATEIPFADNYFDFVFSSSVLEHIPERETALKEMQRVLKPQGRLIMIVPTHMPSIYAFLHVFLYIAARGLKLVFSGQQKTAAGSSNKEGNAKQSLFARFRKNHPSFPLPEPHGSYADVFEELRRQFPGSWKKLLSQCGFKITASFASCITPWLLIEPFSTQKAAQLYARSKNFKELY